MRALAPPTASATTHPPLITNPTPTVSSYQNASFLGAVLKAGFAFFVPMAAYFSFRYSPALGVPAGALSGLLFGALATLFARRQMHRLAVRDETVNGERLLFQGGANHWQGAESRGGWLLLTEKALIFRAHGYNVQNEPLRIELVNIKRFAACATLGVIPNGLRIEVMGGAAERFVVSRRGGWLAKLGELVRPAPVGSGYLRNYPINARCVDRKRAWRDKPGRKRRCGCTAHRLLHDDAGATAERAWRAAVRPVQCRTVEGEGIGRTGRRRDDRRSSCLPHLHDPPAPEPIHVRAVDSKVLRIVAASTPSAPATSGADQDGGGSLGAVVSSTKVGTASRGTIVAAASVETAGAGSSGGLATSVVFGGGDEARRSCGSIAIATASATVSRSSVHAPAVRN